MDFKEFLRYSSSSAALLVAGASAAQALTITQTINLNTQVSQSSGATIGQFNINSLLGPSQSPQDIASATVAAYGYSSPQTQPQNNYSNYGSYSQTNSYSYSFYYSYSCGWFSTCYGTTYVTDRKFTRPGQTVEYDPITDVMLLNVDNNQFFGQDINQNINLGTSSVLDTQILNGMNGVDSYYTDLTTYSQGPSGALSAAGSLSGFALTDLTQDGILPYYVYSGNGQFTLQSLTLSITFVPEPAPLVPIGAGMLLLIFGRRAAGKRRKGAPT